jgi:hypothetical protein
MVRIPTEFVRKTENLHKIFTVDIYDSHKSIEITHGGSLMKQNNNHGAKRALSNKTNINWQIDSMLFLSAIAIVASSLYFLFFPGGYEGGRNPAYQAVVLFDRTGWDMIHTWSGVLMILIATIHFLLHWRWFLMMGKRLYLQLFNEGKKLGGMAWLNLIADATIFTGFILAAVSGIYFLYNPTGRAADPMFLFSRTTWDVIHQWSGVAMILAAIVHFIIHWRWIVNVTRRLFSKNSIENKNITGQQSPVATLSE